MPRVLAVLLLILGIAACTNANDLDETPAYLGNFHFGHNVVVAPNLTRGPASREATEEEWIEAVTSAIDARFARYEGTKLYHLGVSVEGYVLAIPGIPVIAAPRSALIIRVTAWDDANARKLNEKPELITAFESLSGETVVSSGLTQSREVQMENLAKNAAKLIENWLVQQNDQEGWFEDDGKPAKDKPASEKQVRAVDTAEETETGDAETAEQPSEEPTADAPDDAVEGQDAVESTDSAA